MAKAKDATQMEDNPTNDKPSGNMTLGRKIISAVTDFNTLVAIMLAICALATAWASWVGDLHQSDEASNYAKAERLDAEAVSSYSLNTQLYIASFNLWTHVYELNSNIKALEGAGDTQGANALRQQMNAYIETNCPDYQNFKDAVYAALEKGGVATPFDDYPQSSFFADSEKLAADAAQTREEGNRNNLASDSFGLVSVLYSLCLFLFGMIGFYKQQNPRRVVFAVGVVVFIAATAYMLSLPLPNNFDFANYFKLTQ